MKTIKTISILGLAATMLLSSVSLGQPSEDYNKDLNALLSRARMKERISISAISQSVYKLVKRDNSQLAAVTTAVLAQRPEWTAAELYSICRAALIAAPTAFQELKTITMNMDYDVLKKYGISAAKFTGADLSAFMQAVNAAPSITPAMFNSVITQVTNSSVVFGHQTVYPLEVLDNMMRGDRPGNGFTPIIPVIPPVSQAQ